MYLETLLKAKFGVRAELWSIVKRWYPVLTESFDIVCNNDCEFQWSDFTGLFRTKFLYIWDHKIAHLWLCYAIVKRWYLVKRWAPDSTGLCIIVCSFHFATLYLVVFAVVAMWQCHVLTIPPLTVNCRQMYQCWTRTCTWTQLKCTRGPGVV